MDAFNFAVDLLRVVQADSIDTIFIPLVKRELNIEDVNLTTVAEFVSGFVPLAKAALMTHDWAYDSDWLEVNRVWLEGLPEPASYLSDAYVFGRKVFVRWALCKIYSIQSEEA